MSTATSKGNDGCVQCGETFDVARRPESEHLQTSTLVHSDDLCVTRMALTAGQELPPQRTMGDATVFCVEGRVDFTVDDETHSLTAGKLVFLGAKTPYSIVGIDAAVLLVTMVMPNDRPRRTKDAVEEASEESFPASDPPAH